MHMWLYKTGHHNLAFQIITFSVGIRFFRIVESAHKYNLLIVHNYRLYIQWLNTLHRQYISAIENLTHLESLNLSGSVKSLRSLGVLSHLKQLDLNNLHAAKNHDLSFLREMRQLVSLTLPHQKVAPDEVSSLVDLQELSCWYSRTDSPNLFRQLRQLRSLDIYCESDPDFEDIGALGNLEELSVRGIRNLTDLEWVTKLSNLRNLTVLTRSETEFQQAPLRKLKKLESLTLPMGSRFDLGLLKATKGLSLDSVSIEKSRNRNATTAGRIHRPDRLCLNLTNATSIDAFRHLMPSINELDISGTKISDISCLSEFPNIQYLHLADTQVEDLSPIGDLPRLYGLDVAGTEFNHEDLKLIRNKYILSLDLARTPFSDVSRLKEFAYLRSLDLSHTTTTDLTEIVSFPDLSNLTLTGCPVRDISPLRFLFELRTLKLDDTKVDNIQPLSELIVTELDLRGTPVIDPNPDQLFPHVFWNCKLRRPDGTMRPRQQKE